MVHQLTTLRKIKCIFCQAIVNKKIFIINIIIICKVSTVMTLYLNTYHTTDQPEYIANIEIQLKV